MLIKVAGAGAGKTSGLSEKIISDRNKMPKEKLYTVLLLQTMQRIP